MRFLKNTGFLLLALGFLASCAGASGGSADLQALDKQPDEQQQVIAAAAKSPVIQLGQCKDYNYKVLGKFVVLSPVETDSQGVLTKGAWIQSVGAEGCGINRILNVYEFVNPRTGTLTQGPAVPGTTRADIILQRDAKIYAAMAAKWPVKKCKAGGYIEDTEFLKETGNALPGAKIRPWDERWILAACGNKADVAMHFIPDATGTTIKTNVKETRFYSEDSE